MPAWAGLTVPLSHHLDQLLDIFARAETGASSFLLGQYSDVGWWYYFPVIFMVKTPLPSLLLIVIGVGFGLWRLLKGRIDDDEIVAWSVLLIPALGYLAIALTTTVNLGYRHLLPIVPLLIVFAAANWPAPSPPVDRARQLAMRALLPAWLLIISLVIAPDFLAFFNLFAGGPENGWQTAVDSNIDWGQDLAGLARWQAETGETGLWLSYFGEARPAYYGLSYQGLASFPPRLMDPAARPFHPANPAPGIYAISASNLQGVLFEES